jgi:hypothetical protein
MGAGSNYLGEEERVAIDTEVAESVFDFAVAEQKSGRLIPNPATATGASEHADFMRAPCYKLASPPVSEPRSCRAILRNG